MLLDHPSVSVFVGPTTPQLGYIAKGYKNLGPKHGPFQSFRQVVRVRGSQTTEILHFLQRCRKETIKGFRVRYCVLLEYGESTHFKTLLQRREDYRLAIIVHGNECIEGVPQSLEAPDYVLRLLHDAPIDGAPVIGALDTRKSPPEPVILQLPTQTELLDEDLRSVDAVKRKSAATESVMRRHEEWKKRVAYGGFARAVPKTRKWAEQQTGDFFHPRHQRPGDSANARVGEEFTVSEANILLELGDNGGCLFDGAVYEKQRKRVALKYHPDKNPDSAEAEERFKAASRAFQFLKEKYKF